MAHKDLPLQSKKSCGPVRWKAPPQAPLNQSTTSALVHLEGCFTSALNVCWCASAGGATLGQAKQVQAESGALRAYFQRTLHVQHPNFFIGKQGRHTSQ